MSDVVKLDWKDIADAPRDGSPVLLRHYAHDQRPYVAMWKETVYPGLPWVSTLLDHAWPEDAFTHYVAFSDLEALKAERDELREALREIIDLTKSVEPGADVQRFHDLYFATGRARKLVGPTTPNTEDEG